MMKIDVLQASDWLGIYKDGVLAFEGHEIDPANLLDIVGVKYEYKDVESTTGVGRFPYKLEKVWGDWTT